MKIPKTLDILSPEEKEEIIRLIKKDLELVMNNEPKLSEINEPPETPMKAYVRKAKMNVALKDMEEK